MNDIPIIEVVTRNDLDRLNADRSAKGRKALLEARTEYTRQRRNELRFICPWHPPRSDTRAMSLLNIERVLHVLRRIRANVKFNVETITVEDDKVPFFWQGNTIGELYDQMQRHPELSKIMTEIDAETRLGVKVKGRPLWK